MMRDEMRVLCFPFSTDAKYFADHRNKNSWRGVIRNIRRRDRNGVWGEGLKNNTTQ